MAASKVYSDLFSSATSSTPKSGFPRNNPYGANVVTVVYTIATTSLDDAGDFVGLWPVKSGRKWQRITFTCADLDSGGTGLDLDIIQRVVDKDGNITDTILFNAGSAFTAAQTEVTVYPTSSGGDQFPAAPGNVVMVGLYCNTAATTPASGVFKGTITYD